MSKNLIKKVMVREDQPHPMVPAMIEKIQSGYLVGRETKHRVKKSFSPSSLVYGNGACPRYWFYAFSGAEFADDADAYAVANMSNGTMSHERIQKAMKDSGVMVEDEVKVIHSDPPIFGFADGLLEFDGEALVAEIKTMREEAFAYRKQTNKAPSYHLEQLILYMKVLKLSKGVLIYESKNSHELHIIPVEVNDDYIRWVDKSFEWMKEVRKAWEEGKLPTKPYRSNSKVCKGCPVKETCFAGEKGDLKISPMEHLPK
jgi:CRISPR/Cas system-associated exonuclease Cas4 (RecB family)